MSKNGIFKEIIDTIENEDMKKFASACLETIPPYFFDVGASSTGKYHPTYALGDLGLARHTCALVRFLNHTFAIECMNKFTDRERDILRIAGMMHDSRKSGSQNDYENSKYTKFDHPLLAAEVIRSLKKHNIIPEEEVELIAETIETHMGAFNTDKRSDTVLPKPTTKLQKMLHWADYLASRKDIEVKFDNNTDAAGAKPNPDSWTFPFGKYRDWTFNEVLGADISYLRWLRDKADMDIREPLATFLKEME